jgi:hypothetical protein
MAGNNQATTVEKPESGVEKSDENYPKGAMRLARICVKNSPPAKNCGQTFSGRGAIPHRR